MADYVSNKEFLQALVERRLSIDKAIQNNEEIPPVSDFICKCIIQICTRYSLNPKWIAYTYREEMIADAIYNCLKYVDKFEDNIMSMKHLGDVDSLKIPRDSILIGKSSGATVKVKKYNKVAKRILVTSLDDKQMEQKEIVLYTTPLGDTIEIELDGITYSNPFAYFTQFAHNSFLLRIKQEMEQTIAKASIVQNMSVDYFDIQSQDDGEDYGGMQDFMDTNVYANFDIEEYRNRKLKKIEKVVTSPLEEFFS